MTRDPRHDPAPGDVLLTGHGRDRHRIEVTECDGFEVRYRRTEGQFAREVSTIVQSWRVHMAAAEVVATPNDQR
jgi:hypothetical protein